MVSAERQGLEIRVTSLERTVVDVLDRPNHAGGWEEIWRTAEHISILNLDKVIRYAELLDNATTIAKLGFFLEQFKEQFSKLEDYFDGIKMIYFKPLHEVDLKILCEWFQEPTIKKRQCWRKISTTD